MSTMGEKIKELRIMKGLSQEELASMLGYSSRSSINKIEIGRSELPHSKIPMAAKILGTDPSYLIGWVPDLPNGVENNPDKLTENYEENVQYLKDHEEDDLVELYKKIKTDKNLVMLVDKACELEPQDVEQLLRIIDTFKKETVEKINNTKKYD